MKSVIIYQMGKVGSSALVNALSEAGLNAYHSHFLDKKTLDQTMDMIEKATSSTEEIHHMLGQLEQNLRLYILIKRYQIRGVSGPEKLHVISLTRHPLDWYFANLTQNFFNYKVPISRWYNARFDNVLKPGELTSTHLKIFLETVIQEFSRHVPEMTESSTPLIRKLIKAARQASNPRSRLEIPIYQHILLLMRPHFWFDNHVKPLLGVDIMKLDYSADQGYSVFENYFMKLIMIRYEDLEKNIERLREFCGLPVLDLKRLNESSAKPMYKEIEDARSSMLLSDKFLELYRSSRYFRKYYGQ